MQLDKDNILIWFYIF